MKNFGVDDVKNYNLERAKIDLALADLEYLHARTQLALLRQLEGAVPEAEVAEADYQQMHCRLLRDRARLAVEELGGDVTGFEAFFEVARKSLEAP